MVSIKPEIRIIGILEVDKTDRPISPYVIKILQIEEIDKFSFELSDNDVKDAINYFNGKNRDLFRVANDLFPDIVGYDLLKVAILLQLCNVEDEPIDNENWNLHILIVGDPSQGKSKILNRVYNLFPNNQLVDLMNTTQAGLIGAMEKVRGIWGESWMFKRGSIPKANGAVLCLDEKDPKHNYKYINSAMEHGIVYTNKASRDIKEKGNCAVLWGCNPKYEKFDLDMDLKEQIDIPFSTLTRFDLIVALIDKRKDKEEVINVVKSMLTFTNKENDRCNDDLLKKYILYARTFNPTIPMEITNKIAEYYYLLQKDEHNNLTYRVAKSLGKLCRAIAKANLRNEVKEEDFKLAVRIYEDLYLKTILYDPKTGGFDIGKIGGFKKSEMNIVEIIKEVVRELSEESNDGLVFEDEIIERCKEKGLNEDEIMIILKKMVNIGDIEEPKPSKYRLL